MAWLGTDALPINAGWGPAPKLDAPNISYLVSSILNDRREREQQTQKNIADAIKNIQAQRQSGAYGQALQNAGIVPQGVDVSGLSTPQSTELAKLIQDQSPDTESDTLKTAMAAYYNKLATTGGTRGSPRPFTQGQQFNALKTQNATLGSQANELEEQNAGYGLPADVPSGFGYMKNPDGTLRYAKKPDEVAKPDLVSPTDILKGGNQPDWSGAIDPATGQPTMPTFTPEVYKQRQAQSLARRQILEEQARVQQKILNPQNLNQTDVDQANQAQTNQAQTMPQQRFGSEDDARAAGYGSGDTVLLFDPASKQYRAAILH
jgi:hypothetical protein